MKKEKYKEKYLTFSSFVLSLKGINKNKKENNNDFVIPVTLESKIDSFMYWYFKNILKGKHVSKNEYILKIEMDNMIEKISVWYENKYSNYLVDQMIKEGNIRLNALDDFEKILSEDEKRCFLPKYSGVVKLGIFPNIAYLYLTDDGMIKDAADMEKLLGNQDNKVLSNIECKEKNIKEVLDILKKNKIEYGTDIVKAIDKYDNLVYLREEILNCVMYKIMLRGGKITGPKRAFLFAKEFNRDISVPIKYGIDDSDPDKIYFINEYLKSGADENLVCYINYFDRKYNDEKMQTKTINDIKCKECYLFNSYVDEEKISDVKVLNKGRNTK